jgi:hypothetical protein
MQVFYSSGLFLDLRLFSFGGDRCFLVYKMGGGDLFGVDLSGDLDREYCAYRSIRVRRLGLNLCFD